MTEPTATQLVQKLHHVSLVRCGLVTLIAKNTTNKRFMPENSAQSTYITVYNNLLKFVKDNWVKYKLARFVYREIHAFNFKFHWMEEELERIKNTVVYTNLTSYHNPDLKTIDFFYDLTEGTVLHYGINPNRVIRLMQEFAKDILTYPSDSSILFITEDRLQKKNLIRVLEEFSDRE